MHVCRWTARNDNNNNNNRNSSGNKNGNKNVAQNGCAESKNRVAQSSIRMHHFSCFTSPLSLSLSFSLSISLRFSRVFYFYMYFIRVCSNKKRQQTYIINMNGCTIFTTFSTARRFYNLYYVLLPVASRGSTGLDEEQHESLKWFTQL